MKKISIFLLFIFCFKSYSQDLVNPATIGQEARNQRIGNGLQVEDSLRGKGTVAFPNISGSGINVGIDLNGYLYKYPAPVQDGVLSGGAVTWISDYDYNVSPAVYYIGGVLYTSPSTNITLSPSDIIDNRIDLFVLTTA